MEFAYDMRRHSSSMNVIAAMIMLFLPGTFSSTILAAGIFSAFAGGHSIHISGIWWLWVATTIPLTVLVIGFWWCIRSGGSGERWWRGIGGCSGVGIFGRGGKGEGIWREECRLMPLVGHAAEGGHMVGKVQELGRETVG